MNHDYDFLTDISHEHRRDHSSTAVIAILRHAAASPSDLNRGLIARIVSRLTLGKSRLNDSVVGSEWKGREQ